MVDDAAAVDIVSGDAHHVERDAKDLQIEGFAEPADKIADLRPLQITPKAA